MQGKALDPNLTSPTSPPPPLHSCLIIPISPSPPYHPTSPPTSPFLSVHLCLPISIIYLPPHFCFSSLYMYLPLTPIFPPTYHSAPYLTFALTCSASFLPPSPFFTPPGTYNVILDEIHFRDIMLQHCHPPPAKVSGKDRRLRKVDYFEWLMCFFCI